MSLPHYTVAWKLWLEFRIWQLFSYYDNIASSSKDTTLANNLLGLKRNAAYKKSKYRVLNESGKVSHS